MCVCVRCTEQSIYRFVFVVVVIALLLVCTLYLRSTTRTEPTAPFSSTSNRNRFRPNQENLELYFSFYMRLLVTRQQFHSNDYNKNIVEGKIKHVFPLSGTIGGITSIVFAP